MNSKISSASRVDLESIEKHSQFNVRSISQPQQYLHLLKVSTDTLVRVLIDKLHKRSQLDAHQEIKSLIKDYQGLFINTLQLRPMLKSFVDSKGNDVSYFGSQRVLLVCLKASITSMLASGIISLQLGNSLKQAIDTLTCLESRLAESATMVEEMDCLSLVDSKYDTNELFTLMESDENIEDVYVITPENPSYGSYKASV